MRAANLIIDGRNASEQALAIRPLLASREERLCLLGLPQAAVAASSGIAAFAWAGPACAARGVRRRSVSTPLQAPAWHRLLHRVNHVRVERVRVSKGPCFPLLFLPNKRE